MNDSEYHKLADEFLNNLQDAIDEVEFDLDYESRLISGVKVHSF